MVFSRLRLANWKNFRKLDVRLSQRVFVVGANASGKSNLLDAFRFLRDIAKPKGGGLQQALALRARGDFSRIRCLSARQNPLVELDAELGEPNRPANAMAAFRYEVSIRQENKGRRRMLLERERVWKNGQVILDRPDDEDRKDEERLTRTYLESPTTNARFREIAGLFAGISYLHLVPQMLRAVTSTETEQPGEDYYGRNFLVRVSSARERDRKARLKRMLDALSKAVPQFDGFKAEKDAAGNPHLLLRLKHWRPDAGWQNEEQFSDGTIRMIGLFWSMLEDDSVLLFEEPELSLNDRIVEQLPALLWKLQASKGRQVILTTHSYALLSDPSIGGHEVILLEPGKEGTVASNADSRDDIREMLKAGATAGDAVLPHASPAGVSHLFS